MDLMGRKSECMPNLPAELEEYRKQYDTACMDLPVDIINIMGAYHNAEMLFVESRNRELSAEELKKLNECMAWVISNSKLLTQEKSTISR